MNKKIIVLMLLLPLLLMISIFTSTKTVAMSVKVSVSKIEISGNDIVYLDLDKQEKYFINYAVYPVSATNKKIAFSYDRVGSERLAGLEFVDGYIVPKSVGVAKVYLTTVDGGFKDSFIVRVESKKVQQIECSIPDYQLYVGNSIQIETYFYPENVSNKILDYASSNSNIASVDSKGIIQCVGKGQARITITSVDNPTISDTIDIEVFNTDIMDLGQSEVSIWQESGYINISVDTIENYELSYRVLDLNHQEINQNIFVDNKTNFETQEETVLFNYKFVENYIGSMIIEFTITTDNPLLQPIKKECILHKVEDFTATFDSEDAISMTVGDVVGIHNHITLKPADFNVDYSIELSNNNLQYVINGSKLILTAKLPGITNLNITISSVQNSNQKQVLTKQIIVLPSSIDINQSAKEYGIENIWTIGRLEYDGTGNKSTISSSFGSTGVGSGFFENFSYVTNNSDVVVSKDGAITINNSTINEMVEIVAKFEYEGISISSSPYVVRCVGNGVNIRNFYDLYRATNANKVIVLQSDIIEDFGKDSLGNNIYNETTVTKIQSTYDTTHYKNCNRLDEAKVKVLINFKSDVYGNGYEINAHNVAYGLDSAGQLRQDALFKGPLNFVSMSESAGSLVSVKGQDNIAFGVYENVSLNNIILKSCNLQADENGIYDLGDLTYVGTTVEILGDNVDISCSRISNGRTVVRIFGDINDSSKIINIDITNSVLSSAREFIIRMGSNCFVDGDESNPSPYIDENDKITLPAQKYYEKMTTLEQKHSYDQKYIKTFVTLKNSILKDAGLFCVSIDSHFSGLALADGKEFFDTLLDTWYDLAKTSYGAKLTIEGDVRMYDWKNISSDNETNRVLDSSTLIEILGETRFDSLKFDIKELIESVTDKEYFKSIIHKDGTSEYVHGGIAFFGGGKNYGVVDFKNYEFVKMTGYEVNLADVGKSEFQLAAGNESFYFLLNDSNSVGFLPKDQDRLLNPTDEVAMLEAYAPIFKK